MKNKSTLIMIITFTFIMFATVGVYFAVSNKLNKNNDKKDDGYFYTIKFKDFKKMVDEKEDFILVVHQTGCPHCANYLPIVKEISNEYKLDVYNINISDFTESERTKFNGMIHISGTPTTIFFFEGEERTPINRIVGEANKNSVIERFKSLGFISDDNE